MWSMTTVSPGHVNCIVVRAGGVPVQPGGELVRQVACGYQRPPGAPETVNAEPGHRGGGA
jgi:hypothetical protein